MSLSVNPVVFCAPVSLSPQKSNKKNAQQQMSRSYTMPTSDNYKAYHLSFGSIAETDSLSLVAPLYRGVVQNNSKYAEPPADVMAKTAKLIDKMEKVFTLSGKPNRGAIVQLIDICKDDHYGKFVSAGTNRLLEVAIDLKENKGAKTSTVIEIFELFHNKWGQNDNNYLLCNSNFSKGYQKMFREISEYIDANGELDTKKWMKNHFTTVAMEYAEYGHSSSCWCDD